MDKEILIFDPANAESFKIQNQKFTIRDKVAFLFHSTSIIQNRKLIFPVRYTLILTLTLAALFALQGYALHLNGGRTIKSESNFFSSMGRIQAGAYGKADVMVLGSSITGRLPDRAQGFDGWANMGCDGGCALDALRAMDAGILPSATVLLIEANTLHLALDERPTEIGEAMHGHWFRVGMKWPQLSAYARPSAFLYSKLLARRTGSYALPDGEDLGAVTVPTPVSSMPTVALTPEQSRLIGETKNLLTRLSAQGCRAVIVWLPPARPDGSAPAPWILEMARQCGIPYWDLGQQAASGKVTLTDGVHMDAPSAARTMNSLQSALP